MWPFGRIFFITCITALGVLRVGFAYGDEQYYPMKDLVRFQAAQWSERPLSSNEDWLIADVNGDQKSDVVIYNQESRMIQSLLSNGKERFVSGEEQMHVPAGEMLGAGDFNRDRCDDVFFWNEVSQSILIGLSNCIDSFAWQPPLSAPELEHPEKISLFRLPEWRDSQLVVSELPRGGFWSRSEESFRESEDFLPGLLQFQKEESSQFAMADINGDGTAKFLFSTARGRYVFSTSKARSILYSSLPIDLEPEKMLPFRLNRDLLIDILLVQNPRNLLGWWVVLSTRAGGLEYSIRSPFPRNVILSSIEAGDFDGDGLSDLIGVSSGSSAAWVVALRMASPEIIARIDEKLKTENFSKPRICLGYNDHKGENNSQAGHYGDWLDKFGPVHYDCPRGYAVVDATGYCCPLPADDVLLGEPFESNLQCPDDAVATGFLPDRQAINTQSLRCTRVNTSRYRLGAPVGGIYWGTALGERGETRRRDRSELPLALRYGLGRTGIASWNSHGCVGDPAGSLLFDFSGTRCAEKKFRRLEYTGQAGDPVNGSPVVMFPDCEKIDNIYDPTSGCTPRGSRLRKNH